MKTINCRVFVIFFSSLLSGCGALNLVKEIVLLPVVIADGVLKTDMKGSINSGIKEALKPGSKLEKQKIITELSGKTLYSSDSIIYFSEDGNALSIKNKRINKEKWIANNGNICISSSCYEIRKQNKTILYGYNNEEISFKEGDYEEFFTKLKEQIKQDNIQVEKARLLAEKEEIRRNKELKVAERKKILAEKEKKYQKELLRKKASKLMGKTVSWIGSKRIDTKDCAQLFFFKKCMWVTYIFNLKGTIKNVNMENEKFVIEVSKAKLASESTVSLKYYEYKKDALEWGDGIVGGTMEVSFKKVI